MISQPPPSCSPRAAASAAPRSARRSAIAAAGRVMPRKSVWIAGAARGVHRGEPAPPRARPAWLSRAPDAGFTPVAVKERGKERGKESTPRGCRSGGDGSPTASLAHGVARCCCCCCCPCGWPCWCCCCCCCCCVLGVAVAKTRGRGSLPWPGRPRAPAPRGLAVRAPGRRLHTPRLLLHRRPPAGAAPPTRCRGGPQTTCRRARPRSSSRWPRGRRRAAVPPALAVPPAGP
mmetsp:Transcript_15742/g.47088  ORF Transcript_15742/g.47088 Transcript_15742/m.47088 type:complete len:232 (-) Transcript_15742:429-1124(-)